METRLILLGLLSLALFGCGSVTAKVDTSRTLDVDRILKQVNDAVTSSIDPTDKTFPPVSSVTMDLQVSVQNSVDAQGKFLSQVLTAGGKFEKENLHHITLTFVPAEGKFSSATPSPAPNTSRLAAAIRAVYQSVSHAGGPYVFQHGSIELQCTLASELEAGVNVLGLVPISADASTSSQVVQSISLNFGTATKSASSGKAAPSAHLDDI